MKHTLAIDIGNTNITVGLFRGSVLIKKTKISANAVALYGRRLSALLGAIRPDNVVVSSVVPKALRALKKTLGITESMSLRGAKRRSNLSILVLGENAEVPIKNLYKVKRQVGQDRLVNAFAARTLYGVPAVIIDFGTAITFDVVSKRGEYLGGLILPGIEMGLKSLYEATALLPKVELKSARHIIGKNTIDSMRGGILFGYGAMCDGLAVRYRAILGKNTKIIATGGNAKLIKKYSKSIQIVDEDLILKGLLQINQKLSHKKGS